MFDHSKCEENNTFLLVFLNVSYAYPIGHSTKMLWYMMSFMIPLLAECKYEMKKKKEIRHLGFKFDLET